MSDEIIPSHVRVPPEAYAYTPAPYIIFHGKGKNVQRFIFTDQELTEFENEKLTRLEAELEKLKINPYLRHPTWKRNDILRFCYGTGWKTRVSKDVIIKFLKWEESIMPNGYISLFPRSIKLLETGCLYIHGRDVHFRPVIVINFNRFDFKKNSVQDYVYMLAFFLCYVIDNMILPGRVENWVVISDFEKNGFGNLGLGSIKQVMNVLSDNFRCRLGVNYVVNPSKTVYYIWTCLKPFLDAVLIEKVKILNTNIPQELFTHCNPYQIEEKYGGKSPNIYKYWPPYMPNAPYGMNESPRLTLVEANNFNNCESELIDESEVDPVPRRSASINELAHLHIKDSEKKKHKNRKKTEIEEAREVEEAEVCVIETVKEHCESESIEKRERKEKRRLRKIKREMRRKEKDEAEEFTRPEEHKEAIAVDKEDQIIEPEINQGGLEIENQKIIVDNEKVDIGCSLYSSLPSFKNTSNNCVVI